MSEKVKPKFFPALTGVRAFAAILVFTTHAGYIMTASLGPGVQRYFNELSIGLPMFFVLTGFLITLRYYDNFEYTWAWTKKYMISRAARLYPMYFLFTAAAFIYYYFSRNQTLIGDPNHPWFTIFLNLTFLRGFFDDLKFTGVGQGWSITVDVVFYLITPFVFYLIKKKGIFFLQLAFFIPFGYLLVFLFRGYGHDLYGFFNKFTFMLYYTFFGRCIEIWIGIVLALNYNKIKVKAGSKKLTYIGFILMFVCVYFFTLIPLAPDQKFGITTYSGMILDTILLSPAIGIFFLGLIREETRIQKVLSTKFVQLLSNSSFLFYLIHLGFINNFLHEGINWLNDWVFAFYDKHGLDWHSPFEYDQVNIFYVFAGLYGISILLYKFMEEPLNKRIRNYLFLKLNRPLPTVNKPVLAVVEQD
ncbi:acyltransferase family protein [Mucilaginibacter sp. AW1-3]